MKGLHYAFTAAAALAAFLVDLAFGVRAGGALLAASLLAGGAVQGVVALVAAAELSRGRWILPLRNRLFDFVPLLLLGPLTFLAWLRHLDLYAWSKAPNAWLNPSFFAARNLLLLLSVWALGLVFRNSVRADSPRRGLWAVLYLLAFVLTNTLAGFDGVMSFDYPWMGTLFGPYFFIEALYLGAGLAALAAFRAFRGAGEAFRPVLKDTATLFFGFSLLWAGQFFAQYLTIWYGNIPEEVDYLVKRFHQPGLVNLGAAFTILMFAVPFLLLIPRRAKVSAMAPAVVLVTWVGYLLEKAFMLAPAAPVDPAAAALMTAFLLVPVVQVLWTAGGPAAGSDS